MTNRELDLLQARLGAGHFDIDEVGELMAQANLAISMLRGNSTQAHECLADILAWHLKLVAAKSASPPADRC